MLNNFIYAQTKDLFLEALGTGNVLDEAIVFIEDTKEVWNHGHYFGGGSGSGVDPNIISELQTAVSQLEADKLDASTAESTYAKKSELPNLSDYLSKDTADTLYATISQYNTLNQTVGDIQTELTTKLTADDLNDYAKISDLPPTVTDTTVSGWGYMKKTAADEAYAPKSLVETVSGKLDSSAANGFVPTTRKVNGVALNEDIQITAANVGAYTTGQVDEKVTALNSAIAAKADPSSVTAVSNRVTTLEEYFSTSEDSDATINKWHEIVAFLEGTNEGSTVESLLAAKANQSALNETNTNLANVDAKFANYLLLSGKAADSDKLDGYHLEVVSSMPSSPDANTIYYVIG